MTTGTSLVDVVMPRLSDQMEEATVIRWLKAAGDSLRRGEPLVEVETDKATMVYEAELDGVLEEIVAAEGDTVELGGVIARARAEAGAAPPPRREAPAAPTSVQAPAPPPAGGGNGARRPGRQRATPVARRLASRLGVALEHISGTGPGGRIVVADVQKASSDTARAAGGTTEVALTATQRRIAERMTASRADIPEFTLEVEVDMDAAAAMREDLRALGRDPLPSFNDLVVRAAAVSLRAHPNLNASWADGRILRHENVHVGIAVATDDALYVPVVRDADRRTVFEIAAQSRELAGRISDGTIGPDDLGGGTFTVSNLGMFGIRRFQAVINPPQAAILAVGEVAPRPAVAPDGAIVARRLMDVVLSCDHRVVYGAQAARFLETLKSFLEHPVGLVAA